MKKWACFSIFEVKERASDELFSLVKNNSFILFITCIALYLRYNCRFAVITQDFYYDQNI